LGPQGKKGGDWKALRKKKDKARKGKRREDTSVHRKVRTHSPPRGRKKNAPSIPQKEGGKTLPDHQGDEAKKRTVKSCRRQEKRAYSPPWEGGKVRS